MPPRRHSQPTRTATPTVAPPREPKPISAEAPPDPPASYRLVEHLGARLGPALAVLREAGSTAPGTPPIDADGLRRARVATRRLRAFVQLYARALGPKKARGLNRRLREITRALGPVREQQASLDLLARAANETTDALQRAALEHLTVATRARNKAAEKKALRKLQRADPAALADDVTDALDRICGRLLRAGEGVHTYVWPGLESSLRGMLSELPARDPEGDIEVLHEVRIRAKRLRYTLELVRPLLGEHDRTTRRIAKKVQRGLGTFHDAALLQSLAAEQAEVLHDQGHEILGRALASLAMTLAQQRDAALATATPWLAAFDPAALMARLTTAFAGPEPSTVRDGPSEPKPALLE